MADDVISMIKTDHREVERMFSLMRQDHSSHPLVLPLAVAVVTAHSRAARHSIEEHQQAEQLGQQLLSMDPQGDGFGAQLEKFMQAVLHHAQEEESEILPALASAVDGDRLRELGLAFATRRARELTGHGFGGNGASGKTREELYEEARELGVPGRSSMTKDELAREIQREQSRD
jgi:hemerythrin superfamily protein